MTLIGLLVALIIVGAVLYILPLVPIDATIKRIIYVLVILFVVLWLLQAFGLIGGLGLKLK